MRGVVGFVALSLLLAVFHACTFNRDLLNQACNISKNNLKDKRWEKNQECNFPNIYFSSDGELLKSGSLEYWTYTIADCNKIKVTNQTTGDRITWLIKSLTNEELQIINGEGQSIEFHTYLGYSK